MVKIQVKQNSSSHTIRFENWRTKKNIKGLLLSIYTQTQAHGTQTKATNKMQDDFYGASFE